MAEPSFSKVNVELNSYKNAQLLKMLETGQPPTAEHRRTSSQPEMDERKLISQQGSPLPLPIFNIHKYSGFVAADTKKPQLYDYEGV